MAGNKATEEELADIHGSTSEWCKQVLKGVPLLVDGQGVLDEDGKPYMIPASPAHLNIVRQFLKDNKIDSPAAAKEIEDVVESLPSFEGDSAFTH